MPRKITTVSAVTVDLAPGELPSVTCEFDRFRFGVCVLTLMWAGVDAPAISFVGPKQDISRLVEEISDALERSGRLA